MLGESTIGITTTVGGCNMGIGIGIVDVETGQAMGRKKWLIGNHSRGGRESCRTQNMSPRVCGSTK